MGGFLVLVSLRLSHAFNARQSKKPTRGILKGGVYACKEESQKETQKEKEVVRSCEVVVVV